MLFKQRHTLPEVSKAAVEGLLQAAYADFEALRTLRARAASSGLDLDTLPENMALRAFALLGDHERTEQIARVAPHLALLLDKGLIENADIETLPTPMLRFFAHIEHLLDGLLDNSQRIEAGIAAWRNGERSVGGPVIRCAAKASGFYGQEIRLKAHVSGAEWLLVRPSPVFGFSESLLRVPADCPATIPLSCDDGAVLLAAMSPAGEVSVHIINCSTLSTLTEAA